MPGASACTWEFLNGDAPMGRLYYAYGEGLHRGNKKGATPNEVTPFNKIRC